MTDIQTCAQAAYGLHSNARNPSKQRSKVSNGQLLPMTLLRRSATVTYSKTFASILVALII